MAHAVRIVEIDETPTPVPYTRREFHADFPNVSLPEGPMAWDQLAHLGIYPLVQTARPSTGYDEDLVEGVSEAGGVYTQTWQVVAKDPGEAQAILDRRRERMRLGIVGRMLASDFTQLADAPLTAPQLANWQTFRSDLRALWNADPFDFTWPAVPAPAAVRTEFEVRLQRFRDFAG